MKRGWGEPLQGPQGEGSGGGHPGRVCCPRSYTWAGSLTALHLEVHLCGQAPLPILSDVPWASASPGRPPLPPAPFWEQGFSPLV